jgi:RNA 2',3'-cyclic 3'-phosphodiesterase
MSRTRTFIGIPLPRAIRDRLCELQRSLGASAPGVKWVEAENLHITLVFLGEVDDRELPAVCRAVQEAIAAHAAFPLSVEGPGCFPNTRRPRVLWVGAGMGAQEAVAIHDALEAPLFELGCYRREERKYTPHVTLGRLRGEAPGDALTLALAKHQGFKAGELTVDQLHVMSSELTSRGPIYAILSRAKLA